LVRYVISKSSQFLCLLWKFAGIVGKVVEYPFDTVKVRLQSQPENLPLRYTGPLDCFKQSLQSGGINGLYRGVSAPLFGAAVETSSLFFSYRLAQNAVGKTLYEGKTKELPLQALVLCGAISGALTSILLTPIELVKCQMQAESGQPVNRPKNPLAVITSVYRHHGILGFWRGQLGTLIRETGGSAAWFGTYEGVSAVFRKKSNASIHETGIPPIWQQLLAGASAGMSYNFIFYPADTIKSRMQTEEVAPILKGKKPTFLSVGQAIWKQQGIKGLYRGCGITVARSAPSSAFIFAIYESLRKWFA
jgi:mitochondrial ornithine carrier protein